MEELQSFDIIFKQHIDDEIERYADLKKDIKELTATVEQLVSVWNQAKGAISIIKWLVAVSGCLGGFVLFIKDHIK